MPSYNAYGNYSPSYNGYYQSTNTAGGSFPPANSFTSQTVPPQPIQGLIKVTGIEGAKAYQMPPNSVMPLFDANNDIMYIKSTDGAGFPTIKEFSFALVEEQQPQVPNIEYVSRSEFDKLVEQVKELTDGEQSVPTID